MSYDQQHLPSPGRKRKRAIPETSAVEDIAWTAARCNRLLRSITSRIESLRRLLGPERSRHTVPSRPRNLQAREHWSSTDPIWLPNGRKKPQIRTYSTKKISQQKEPKPKTRSFILPSPFVKMLRQGETSRNDDIVSSPIPATDIPKAARRSRQLPIKPGSPKEQNEIGLVSALVTVLRTTEAKPVPARRGAQSLLSTCMRKVPAYIDLERELNCEDDQIDDDSSTEILSYLEDLGIAEGGGWYGLREVVRSQAIHCITQAITDNTLSDICITRLTDTCKVEDAFPEAERILHAWCSRSEHSSALQIWNQVCLPHTMGLAVMRILRTSVSNTVALLGMSREPDFWSGLLSALARRGNYEATNVLHQCIEAHIEHDTHTALSEAQLRPLTNGIKELASKICTMAITSSVLAHAPMDSTHLSQTLYRAAVLVAFASRPSVRYRTTQPFVQAAVILDSLVEHDDRPDERLLHLRSVFQRSSSSVLTSPSHRAIAAAHQDFAASVARDVVALDGSADLGLVGDLIDRIGTVLKSTDLSGSAANMLRQVALQVVTSHSQSTQHSTGDYTHQLEHILSSEGSKSATPQTPYRPGQNRRLRWEEGLSEWVQRTPFTAPVENVSRDEHPRGPEQENHAPAQVVLPSFDNSPRSPDELTLTPPPARRWKQRAAIASRSQTRRALVDVGPLAHPQVIIPRQLMVKKRRQSKRATRMKVRDEESGDELSF